MSNPSSEPVPVLIVGAGPVGLTLAIELGMRGIRCLLAEQRDGRLRVPRMSQVSGRNMEYCRRWGIAEKVRNAVWSSSHPLDFVYTTSLIGEEVARLKVPSYQTRGSLDYSPEGTCTCPQIYFDPILAEKAKSLAAVELRYHTKLVGFTPDKDGVTVRLANANTGEEQTVRAAYLIGCDGANSLVRRTLDIPFDGLGTLATSINIFFRSPELSALHDKGWARFYRLVDEDGCWGELIAIDGKEFWRLTVFDDPDPNADADAYLRRMVGRDFAYEIIDVSPWERRDCVARSYGGGRVFIAGDAAHEMSPTGGSGMHSGVCEAANLAWKLEAVLKGWGGPKLLSSYEPECKPLAAEFIDMSTAAFNGLRGLPGPVEFRAAAARDNSWTRGLSIREELRCQRRYENSPICIHDGTPAPEGDARLSPPSRPGTRAPHRWISEGKSTIDLFGDGFVLLRLGDTPPDAAPLVDAAKTRGVPLSVIDLAQPDVAAAFGKKLVLVRPDAHIAWHADTLPADCLALIDRVRGA